MTTPLVTYIKDDRTIIVEEGSTMEKRVIDDGFVTAEAAEARALDAQKKADAEKAAADKAEAIANKARQNSGK